MKKILAMLLAVVMVFALAACGSQQAAAPAATSAPAQSGDSAAFEAIVRAHEATVYRLALRQLGSREDAEDAAQEVFLKAYTGLQSFRGDSKLSVWLYRITSNVCIDLLRRRRETVSRDDASYDLPYIPRGELDDSSGLFSRMAQEELDGMLAAAKEKIKKAKEFAVASEYPDPSEFLTDVYAG